MKLHCPSCGRMIPATDINIGTNTAKCSACGSVFAFGDDLQRERRARSADPAGPIARPARMHVDEFAGTTNIRWRWFGLHYAGMLVFCIVWDSFLVFWYTKALTDAHTPWLMIVFPIGHLLVGVIMTYVVVCGFLNKTLVRVSSSELSVRHGPVPWPGNRNFLASEIRSLGTESPTVRRYSTHNDSMPSFSVTAITSAGVKVKLLSGLRHEDEAIYLARVIEQRLHLQQIAA